MVNGETNAEATMFDPWNLCAELRKAQESHSCPSGQRTLTEIDQLRLAAH